MKQQQIKDRLEYLRNEIKQERISYGELAELQSLSDHIEKGDVLLQEWAGVPEDIPRSEPVKSKFTVKELRDYLKRFDDNNKVVFSGDEELNNITEHAEIAVLTDYEKDDEVIVIYPLD